MSHRRVLVLAVLLASFSQLAAYIAVPAVPQIGRELTGLSGEWVVAVYLIVVAVAQLLWGPLSDAHGRRRTVLIGIALGIAGSIMCVFATHGVVLVIGRFFQAFGFASGLVNSRAMLRDRFDGRSLTEAIATTTVWIAVIPTLTPATGGLLTSWLGWRAPFVFTALSAIAFMIVLILMLESSAGTGVNGWSAYGVAVRDRGIMLGSLVGGLHFGALTALIVGVPNIASRVAGLNPTQIGLLISLMTPMFIVGALVTRARPQLTSRRPVMLFLLLQIACVVGLIACLQGGGGLLVVGLAIVAIYACLQGALLPAITTRALAGARAAGVSASIFGSVQLAGGGLAAGLVPVSSAAFGVLGAGIVMLTLLLAALGVMSRS